jgi:hypothetical protein
MNRVVPSNTEMFGYSVPYGNKVNTQNMKKGTVAEELAANQQPLGTKFKSYQLNQASNYWTLDPFQYSITRFDYNFPTKPPKTQTNENYTYKNDPGLIYKGVDFEKLLPAFTQTKKSVNDFRAQDYHRFEANDGYFNPKESVNNSDLWYYGADNNARTNGLGIAGAAVNVQDLNHIIFPEPQRGGVDTKNLTKYSWSNYTPTKTDSWESQNNFKVNNDGNCNFFDYNSGYKTNRAMQPFDDVYKFDSNYCRGIGISGPYEGSMPFNPSKIA